MAHIEVETLETNLQTITQVKTPRRELRHRAKIPGRIIWRDSRGTQRFSSIVTRDVSHHGAYVECLSGPPIPMHRLVCLQFDRSSRTPAFLPSALTQGKVLSAICRVGPVSHVTGLPDGYALRLLIEPAACAVASEAARFTRDSLALPA